MVIGTCPIIRKATPVTNKPFAIEFDASQPLEIVSYKSTISELFPGNSNDQLCALVMTYSLPYFSEGNNLSLKDTATQLGISHGAITKKRSLWARDGTWQRVYDRLVAFIESEAKIPKLKLLSEFPAVVDTLLDRLKNTKSDKNFAELLDRYMEFRKEFLATADSSGDAYALDYLSEFVKGDPSDIVDSGINPPQSLIAIAGEGDS